MLDCVRGVAILLVLGAHIEPATGVRALAHLTQAWWRGGWIGVDLFFVLSGFLVAGLLFKEYQAFGRIDFGRFLIRRAFKIYPLFWLYLLTAIGMKAAISPEWPKIALSEFLFVQNYFASFYPHTWSLAVEEHFYLMLAFILWLIVHFTTPRPKLPIIHLLSLTFAIVCLGMRVAMPPVYSDSLRLYPTHLRIDSLMAGAALASWFWFERESFVSVVTRLRIVMMVGGVVLLVPPFCFDVRTTPFIYTYGFTLNYIGAMLLVACAAVTSDSARWGPRTLAWIGRYSFAIYLWHFPIERIAHKVVLPRFGWGVYALFYLFGAVIFGGVVGLKLERPLLAFRDRMFPASSRRSAEVAVTLEGVATTK